MKNKKMVATLASLCLIVVAVVAAVVGVLAAVTQNVSNSFKVEYIAKNVYATVTLKSKGPSESSGVRTRSSSWDEDNNDSTDTFMPQEETREAELVAADYNFGWDSESEAVNFYGVAIYQFKFDNLGQNVITVTKALSSLTNLTPKFYKSTNASGTGASAAGLDFTHITADWGDDGALNTSTFAAALNIDGVEGNDIELWSTDSLQVPATTAIYVYMVVAVTSTVANIAAETDLGSALTFTLVGSATA